MARTASATTSADAPPAASRAPASTAYPMAMPSARESTTVTGTGDSAAASSAPAIVLDMSPEMCTDTTASAPRGSRRLVGLEERRGGGARGGDRGEPPQRRGDRPRVDVDALGVLAATDDDVQRHDVDVEPRRGGRSGGRPWSR